MQPDKRSIDETNEARPTAWPWWLVATFLAALLLLLLGTLLVAVRADRNSELCLRAMTPLIDGMVSLGRSLMREPGRRVIWFGAVAAGIILVAGIGGIIVKGRKGIRSAFPLTAGSTAILAQTAMVVGKVRLGWTLYATVPILVFLWRFLPRSLDIVHTADNAETAGTTEKSHRSQAIHLVWEMVALLAITSLAAVFRLWALNQLPNFFDGELSLEMAVSTTLAGSFEYSFVRTQTPAGLWYHLWHYLTLNTCGTTLLTTRLVSAILGILTIPLFYGFLRSLAGRTAAVIGAILLAVDPIDVYWGRTEVFAYASPIPVVVALCWSTWVMLERERWWSFLVTALLMGLSYHLYPSGQTAFLIPLFAAGLHIFFRRGFLRRSWWKLPFLAGGTALWALGGSIGYRVATGAWRWIDPLARNRGKTLWSRAAEGTTWDQIWYVTTHVAENIRTFAEKIFVKAPSTHYTSIHALPGMQPRYEPAFAAALLAIGLIGLLVTPRKSRSRLLLCWAIVAMLPGILSSEPVARRMGTVFPAFLAIAAVAAVLVSTTTKSLYSRRFGSLTVIVFAAVAVGFHVIIMGSLIFSVSPAPIASTRLARAIHSYVRPDTLITADLETGNYSANEVIFLSLDRLRRGDPPPAWRRYRQGDWPTKMFHPSPGLEDYYYQSTWLRSQIPLLQEKEFWSRYVFIFQDDPARRSAIQLLQSLYPDAVLSRQNPAQDRPGYDFVAFEVDGETVLRVSRPVVAIKRGALDRYPGEDGWIEQAKVRLVRGEYPRDEWPNISLSVGLWVPEQSWLSFRLGGANTASIRLNGERTSQGDWAPLTRGVHRLDIDLDDAQPLPIRLESRSWYRKDYRPVPGDNLVSPEVCLATDLKPEAAVPYPGFHEPVKVTETGLPHVTAMTVSATGHVALVYAIGDTWTIRTILPDGSPVGRWSLSGQQGIPDLAFADRDTIAVLAHNSLQCYSLDGKLEREIPFPPDIRWVRKLGIDQEGRIFFVAPQIQRVAILNPAGEVVQRLPLPPNEYGEVPVPWDISVPASGPVAVVDQQANLHLLESDPSASGEYRWSRVIDPGLSRDVKYFATTPQGWTVAHYVMENEVHVLDENGNRRIAEEPEKDLTVLLRNRCVRLRSDAAGNLYTFSEGEHSILKLTPWTEMNSVQASQ